MVSRWLVIALLAVASLPAYAQEYVWPLLQSPSGYDSGGTEIDCLQNTCP